MVVVGLCAKEPWCGGMYAVAASVSMARTLLPPAVELVGNWSEVDSPGDVGGECGDGCIATEETVCFLCSSEARFWELDEFCGG